MRIPFLPGKELDAGIFTIPFLAFVILGTVNGVNFTDGLDGLAASVTILNAVFFSVASIGLGNRCFPVSACGYRESLGFLVFNVFPAASLWAIQEVWHSAVSSREWRVSYVSPYFCRLWDSFI